MAIALLRMKLIQKTGALSVFLVLTRTLGQIVKVIFSYVIASVKVLPVSIYFGRTRLVNDLKFKLNVNLAN